MPALLLLLVMALAAGTLANVCTDPDTFNSTASVGDEESNSSMACGTINAMWAYQRDSAASDAAACDQAFYGGDQAFKAMAWLGAAACCGGADDSVCGALPNMCTTPATFVSTATATVGDETFTCDQLNLGWAIQRGSAASDAAACDKAWLAAAACCGGVDDTLGLWGSGRVAATAVAIAAATVAVATAAEPEPSATVAVATEPEPFSAVAVAAAAVAVAALAVAAAAAAVAVRRSQ